MSGKEAKLICVLEEEMESLKREIDLPALQKVK